MMETVGWQSEVVEAVEVMQDFSAIKEGLRLLLNRVKKVKKNGCGWNCDFLQMSR